MPKVSIWASNRKLAKSPLECRAPQRPGPVSLGGEGRKGGGDMPSRCSTTTFLSNAAKQKKMLFKVKAQPWDQRPAAF